MSVVDVTGGRGSWRYRPLAPPMQSRYCSKVFRLPMSDIVVSVKSIFFSWASDFLPRYVLQASLKLQCPWPSNPQN